jgi:hypothetical protein
MMQRAVAMPAPRFEQFHLIFSPPQARSHAAHLESGKIRLDLKLHAA